MTTQYINCHNYQNQSFFLIMGGAHAPKKATFCYYQNNFMSIKAQFKPFFLPSTGAQGGTTACTRRV